MEQVGLVQASRDSHEAVSQRHRKTGAAEVEAEGCCALPAFICQRQPDQGGELTFGLAVLGSGPAASE